MTTKPPDDQLDAATSQRLWPISLSMPVDMLRLDQLIHAGNPAHCPRDPFPCFSMFLHLRSVRPVPLRRVSECC